MVSSYLLKPDDLAYWRGSNIPVILVLVRLSDNSMFWKPVDAGSAVEPRRLRFDKAQDRLDAIWRAGSEERRPQTDRQ